MGNLTNKNLQRMRDLMGNRKPINETKLISAVELVKKSPNGKFYGVVRENKKYFIKESSDGSNFDFIGGVANKGKNQFESYEQAVRRLNLMLEDTDVLTPDIIEEKKFVIKSKKKSEPKLDTFDFGGEKSKSDEEMPSFDFGGEKPKGGEEETDFDFGSEEETDFDFGGDKEEEKVDFDISDEEDLDTEDDPIKSIQKMTGKLGQKIRDTEDLSSDTMKWVAKSVLSALDLEGMDSDDKKDLIRAIKHQEEEGSDEEFDFMEDENVDTQLNIEFPEDDMVNWDELSDEEKYEVLSSSFPGDEEEPIMNWDEEVDFMEDEEELYGPGEPIEDGEEILLDDELPYYEDVTSDEYFDNEDWMSDEEETYPYYEVNNNEDYMSKFAGDVKRGLKSGNRNLEPHELYTHLRKIKNKLGGRTTHIDNDMVVGDFGFIKVKNDGYELHKEGEKFPKNFRFDELGKLKQSLSGIDYMDYMNNPKTAPTKPSTKPDVKPGKPGTDKPSPSKRPFTPPPYITPGEEPAPKAKDEWERNQPYDEKYVDYPYEHGEDYDYMEDDYQGSWDREIWYSPDDQEVEPLNNYLEYEEIEFPDYESFRNSKFGEDKSNKWFGPGESGKSSFNQLKNRFGTLKIRKKREIDFDETDKIFQQLSDENDQLMDYMDDDTCPACQGRGHMRTRIGFGSKEPISCPECEGSGRMIQDINDVSSENEISEPFVNDVENPFDYESTSTLPGNMVPKYSYKEKFNFPFPIDNDVDYMDDFDDNLNIKMSQINRMNNPKTAPTKPSTKPDVKPGKPGTDKPSPSKRPFTPPPHITPGEEPAPKARYRRRF